MTSRSDSEVIGIDDEVAMIVDGVLAFYRGAIVPIEERNAERLGNPRRVYDEYGRPTKEWVEIRREARRASTAAGYCAMFAPIEVGGGWWPGCCRLVPPLRGAVPRVRPGRVLLEDAAGKWNRGPSAIIRHLSPTVRESLGDELMSGEQIFCFALSEPDAGSDAWAITTRAERTAGGWKLNGVKQWISDSPYAEHVLVFAATDMEMKRARKGGISAFFLPMSTPGVSVASVIKTFGEIGGTRAVITFDDVFVPDHGLVGTEGSGLALADRRVARTDVQRRTRSQFGPLGARDDRRLREEAQDVRQSVRSR